jgi:hypothetical protein
MYGRTGTDIVLFLLVLLDPDGGITRATYDYVYRCGPWSALPRAGWSALVCFGPYRCFPLWGAGWPVGLLWSALVRLYAPCMIIKQYRPLCFGPYLSPYGLGIGVRVCEPVELAATVHP